MPTQILLCLLALVFSTLSVRAEDQPWGSDDTPLKSVTKEGREPAWAFKLRLLPLLGGIASSASAGRFDHGLGVDFEKYLSPTGSLNFALMHNRLSIGVTEPDAAGVKDITYIDEFQVGAYYTYYHQPPYRKARQQTRVGAYLILADNSAGQAFTSRRYHNHARRGVGARITLDYGLALRFGQAKSLEMAAGLSVYVSNPYDPDLRVGSYSPNFFRNLFFGIGDFVPSITVNLSQLFF